MKTRRLFQIVVVMLGLTMGLASAQNAPHKGFGMKEDIQGKKPYHGEMIPGLTEDQKAKIKDLRIAFMKEIQPIHNQMGELKAKQKSLTSVDKPDMKAINSNIDEITKLQNQLMKATVNHRMQVRNLLTDEQKLIFDTHSKGRMNRGFQQGRMM